VNRIGVLALSAAALAMAGTARAQDRPAPLEVGAEAPGFTLPGATMAGLLDQPVSLSDFKGQTVVLAFFFKARTKG
jgi:thioredoxin-dependent peroxiredoxin